MSAAEAQADGGNAPLAGMARGGAANLVGAGVTAVAQFGLTVVLTRTLSSAEVGAFFTATSFFLLVTVVSNLGANTGLVYFLSHLRAGESRELIPAHLRTAFLPVVVLSTIMGVVLFVGAPWFAATAVQDASDIASGYVRGIALFVPLASIESLAVAASRGMGSMRANVLVSMITRPVAHLVLAAVAVAFASGAVVGIAWGFAYVPAAALALAMMVRSVGRVGRSRQSGVAGPFWRYTRPRALTSIIQITVQRFDILLVAALGGAVAAGVYAAATRFVVIGQMASNALALATEPRIAVAVARGSRAEVRVMYSTTTAWLMLLTWPVFLVLIVYPTTLLSVFGSGYDVEPVVVLIAAAMLVSTACGLVDTVLAMSGRTGWNLANAVAGLALQVGLDLLLIPSLGYVGAAIGWAASIIFRNLTGLVLVLVSLALQPLSRATTAAAVLTLVTFGAVPLAVRSLLGEGWTSLVVAVLLGGSLQMALAWRARHTLRLGLLGQSLAGRLGRRGGRQED